MRIAFLAHWTALYGASRSLLDLLQGLEGHGVESCVLSPGEGPLVDVLRERGVPVAVLPFQRSVGSWYHMPGGGGKVYPAIRGRGAACKRLFLNARVFPALLKQLQDWHVDLVYTNSSVVTVGLRAARRLGLPHVWHLREFIDLDYDMYLDWGWGAFRRALCSSQAVVAVSDAVRRHLLPERCGKHAEVVYNGVAWTSEFDRLRDAAAARSERKRPYTFATIGLLHPAKGQEEAIRAFATVVDQFPDTRLLIVGGGESLPLESVVSDLGIGGKVEFWGYVEDPYSAYHAADAVVVCSRNEAFGRVAAEAMSACLPVIGYDGGGTSEIVERERTGLLYRGGAQSLSECMLRFVQDPWWARSLGENGWQVARERFSIETSAAQVHEILASLIASSQS